MRQRKIFWWMILIIWMVLIFLFSAQPAVQSDALSTGLISKIAHIFIPRYDLLPEADQLAQINYWNHIIRKLAHVFIYFVFSILLISMLRQYRFKKSKKYLLTLLICLLYAITDEWHQNFVVGRGPGLLDVAIDLVGILISLIIFSVHEKHIKRRA